MLAVLLLGQFMGLLDALIVNVAVPAIGVDLHTSGAVLQLIVGGYIVAYAMLLITGARLGAVLGRRTLYLTGAAVFTVASLGCGLAMSGGVLVGLRCLQGAGAAMMGPQIMSVIQLRFTGPDRAKALSAFGAVLSLGAVAGLVLGGVIVNADLFGLSWRPAFFVNVPLGLLLVLAVPKVMPADPPRGRPSIDLAGLLTATPSVLLVVLPLILGHELGWPAWTFAAIAAGFLLAAVFLAVERRVASPLLNLAVLRAPGFGRGLTTLALMQVAYGGFLFVFTLHLEAGLGDGALRAGLTYLPMSTMFGLVGYHWRRLPAPVRPFVGPAGLTCCALGYLTIGSAMASGGHGGVLAAAGLILTGIGLGLAAAPLLTQALLRVPPAKAADASGVLTTTIQLGQVVGVAGFGTLFFTLRTNGSAPALGASCLWLAAISAAGALIGLTLSRSLRSH
jgi:MFS family permease